MNNAPAPNGQTKTIHMRLLEAQKRYRIAIKDTQGNRSKYATLGNVWDACKDALHEQGLYISHHVQHVNDGQYECVTRVHDEDGNNLECAFPLVLKQADPQAMGSALTYARRYSLSALLGIIADVDDDGQAATDAAANQRTAKPAAKPATESGAGMPDAETVAAIEAELERRTLVGKSLPEMWAVVDQIKAGKMFNASNGSLTAAKKAESMLTWLRGLPAKNEVPTAEPVTQ